MQESQQRDGFQHIDEIIVEPLKFKVKLAIGEDAYTSLRVRNAVVQVWDVAGVATTAAVVAKSSVVASTFFAPTGWLAALGIGTAVTPIGWVVAAGVLTGGAWYGITRKLKRASADKVDVVPRFINTPLDVLALGLFDLMVPLALKAARDDGGVDPARRRQLARYLVAEWGYDAAFVEAGIGHLEAQLDDVSVRDLAQTLAGFARQNPDCNFREMAREILQFLRDYAASDGSVEASEKNAIAEIEAVFAQANRFSPLTRLRDGMGALKRRAGGLLGRRG